MRVFFIISVFLSGLVTFGAIWIVHQMTANFNPDGSNPLWSNGNPGLFFMLWPMPFIFYFLFSMIFVFEKIHNTYKVNRRRFITGYTILFLALISFTLYRIIDFNRVAQPYFEYEIGYLNPYTNDLFFNVWTLLAALCIPAIVSFYLEGRKKSIIDARG
ncbi:hypothetical protein H9635_05595 [Solibacillus sp. A46]|uniref:Uncharacterized protein n=1 Tax=Solibacillus faecavium TaxID=2762221 RepID=A0ABR8XW88_9BACL|nr:hypothetical protein [Solibacillus faecavium]MBD8036209.1 hypothetical protein [Solibacillus faecavium]